MTTRGPGGLDVAALRADTPGCEDLIHFDNAGAALQPLPVRRAVLDHLAREQAVGGYAAEDDARAALDGLYSSLAALVGCDAGEIAFAENATRAWDMIFYGLAFRPGEVILTSRTEYASNVLAFLQTARRTGAEIVVLKEAEAGGVDLADLAHWLDSGRVKLVAISHVPSQSGLVQPAAEIGGLTRAAGVAYLLDACQSVGQLPLDVKAIGCDFLTGTGRKYLRGPRGTGFLYMRQALIEGFEPPFVDLRAATWTGPGDYALTTDARRLETWESFVAGRLGLAAAADYALALGASNIESRISALAGALRARLGRHPRILVQDRGERLCGIVTFTVRGEDLHALHDALRRGAINTTVVTTPTARFDFEARDLSAVLRASVHCYNTHGEVDAFGDALDSVIGSR